MATRNKKLNKKKFTRNKKLNKKKFTIKKRYAKGKSKSPEDTCGICLENLEKKELTDNMCINKHGNYHKSCLNEWLNVNNNCPSCRVPMINNELEFKIKEIKEILNEFPEEEIKHIIVAYRAFYNKLLITVGDNRKMLKRNEEIFINSYEDIVEIYKIFKPMFSEVDNVSENAIIKFAKDDNGIQTLSILYSQSIELIMQIIKFQKEYVKERLDEKIMGNLNISPISKPMRRADAIYRPHKTERASIANKMRKKSY